MLTFLYKGFHTQQAILQDEYSLLSYIYPSIHSLLYITSPAFVRGVLINRQQMKDDVLIDFSIENKTILPARIDVYNF